MARQAGDGPAQVTQRSACAVAVARSGRVAHPQEERHHEHRIPDRGERPHRAGILTRGGIEPENRRNAGHGAPLVPGLEGQQHDRQCDHTAQIAEGPARAGDAAHLALSAQLRQVGIGEDGGELHPDEADAEKDQRPDGREPFGSGIPGARRPQHIGQRKGPDPWHPPARTVGDGAQHRRQQRDGQPGDGQPIAPERLRLGVGGLAGQPLGHELRACHLGEIGAEDEGQHQRVVGLAGPVEEPPAPDAPALGRARDLVDHRVCHAPRSPHCPDSR